MRDLLNPPSNHFEALTVERGRYSIRIDRRWRLCFRWAPFDPQAEGDRLMAPGEPCDVEITNHYN